MQYFAQIVGLFFVRGDFESLRGKIVTYHIQFLDSLSNIRFKIVDLGTCYFHKTQIRNLSQEGLLIIRFFDCS